MRADVFKYLDELRDSNITNMYGATPFIQAKFGLEKSTARNYLTDWITSKKRIYTNEGKNEKS